MQISRNIFRFLGYASLVFTLILSSCSSTREKKDKADLYMQRGVSLIEAGNLPAALKDLLSAEELDPENPIIQNNLGLVYFLREKIDLSINHFSKAISLNKNYTEARNNLARVLVEKKRFKEADEQLKIVLADLTYGNQEGAYVNQGLLYFNQGEYLKSQESFLKSLQINPENCLAQSYFGRAYLELNNTAKAAESLDRAVSLCQRELFDEPHYFSAIAHFRLGEKEKAKVRFNEILKFYPKGKYKEKARAMLDLIDKGTSL